MKTITRNLLSALPLVLLQFAAASSPDPTSATPYVTAAATELRLSPQTSLTFSSKPQATESEPAIFLDRTKTFQTVVGIGGALTDSAAEVFDQLPPATQDELIRAYFDRESGIGYSLARTSIASCDFSSETYSYTQEGDTALATFTVAHDEAHRIPFIKRALVATHGDLTLFASPWSPPGWMKDSLSALKGGKLKPEYRQVWARHFVSFIKAYQAHGIPVWGITVQNEPMAVQTWESCVFTADEERDFIRDHLGPTLEKEGLKQVKLIAWDHNRDLLFHRASVLLNDPAAAKYIWGLGFHWYETWTKGGMQFENVRRVHEAFPEKALMFTEGCVESFDSKRLTDWALGERYGLSMINDFNAGVVGWTDWNVLLDGRGGPNHVGNFCFAPVHADAGNQKLVYTNSYYYIGHFSKFVRPGAKRIAAVSSRDNLLVTAFANPDGALAVIVMNQGDHPTDATVWIAGMGAPTQFLPHSMTTLIVR